MLMSVRQRRVSMVAGARGGIGVYGVAHGRWDALELVNGGLCGGKA